VLVARGQPLRAADAARPSDWHRPTNQSDTAGRIGR
jgi:hypothetical protein